MKRTFRRAWLVSVAVFALMVFSAAASYAQGVVFTGASR